MATKKKLLQAAAGQAGGAALNVEEVFSTYLYTGNGSSQTITNGIDLDGEGGLVWSKDREAANAHTLYDTERGGNKRLTANNNSAEITDAGSNGLTFNSDGFTVTGGANQSNASNKGIASWTFRKAPKFFDVVTYTGNGVAGNTISHNLGAVPAVIIVKRLDAVGNWAVYHKDADATVPEDKYLYLNDTAAVADAPVWNDYAPTSTDFQVGSYQFVNNSGSPFVAYLFAHNDGDGEFGPNGDADIIKCGSYTGNQTSYPEIDLGFEPQWVMIKRTDSTSNWYIFDSMRGIADGGTDAWLAANLTGAESNTTNFLKILPNGFALEDAHDLNLNGANFIYIAIRRGPMAVPESATDVFDVNLTTSNQFVTTGFPVDLQLGQYTGGGGVYVVDRLRGMSTSTTGSMQYLAVNNNTEASNSGTIGFNGFVQDGFSHTLGNFEQALWSWRRAPNYFDIVCTTGAGAGAIAHNLGVVPEMIWHKKRQNDNGSWYVYHSSFSDNEYVMLQSTSGKQTSTSFYTSAPSATHFNVGGGNDMSGLGDTFVSYLFASVDGVSKVGSYTGTGTSSLTVDCGFSSGARFVMIKRTDAAGNWTVFDAERGIVAGADPFLYLNATNAEMTSGDRIDPNSTGFEFNNDGSYGDVNASGGTYIFYAIA